MSTLSEAERERFENRLRWHFNVVAEEGKDSAYISTGISNAVLDLESIVAARVEAALTEAAGGLETHVVNVECAGCGSPNWAPMTYAARLIDPRSTNQEADDAL